MFNPNKTADPPDTDPAFDPEADAARIKADTAAKAQVRNSRTLPGCSDGKPEVKTMRDLQHRHRRGSNVLLK